MWIDKKKIWGKNKRKIRNKKIAKERTFGVDIRNVELGRELERKEYNFQWNALIFKFPRVINQELCMNNILKLEIRFFSKGGGIKIC